LPVLIKDLNEAAALAFQQEQSGSAIECLKKAEQLLEVIHLFNKI